MAQSNLEAAKETQLKHHFYLLTLTFTVLALAVQTAKFSGPIVADGFELLGWLGLLSSGLLGIFRFDLVPKVYQLFDAQERLKRCRRSIFKAGLPRYCTAHRRSRQNLRALKQT
jgi:hypothetical protein